MSYIIQNLSLQLTRTYGLRAEKMQSTKEILATSDEIFTPTDETGVYRTTFYNYVS